MLILSTNVLLANEKYILTGFSSQNGGTVCTCLRPWKLKFPYFPINEIYLHANVMYIFCGSYLFGAAHIL